MAEYMRQLIEMGRRMEGISLMQQQNSNSENTGKLPTHADANFWEHNLSWVLESRYLLRYLIDNMTHQSVEQRQAVLNTAAEKARKWVAEFMGEKP